MPCPKDKNKADSACRVPTTLDVIKCENGKIKRWFYHTPSALLVSLSQEDKEGENGKVKTAKQFMPSDFSDFSDKS